MVFYIIAAAERANKGAKGIDQQIEYSSESALKNKIKATKSF